MVDRMGPWLKWSETWVRPRRWPLRTKTAEQIFGLFALLVAFIVVVPIPFGNSSTTVPAQRLTTFS